MLLSFDVFNVGLRDVVIEWRLFDRFKIKMLIISLGVWLCKERKKILQKF